MSHRFCKVQYTEIIQPDAEWQWCYSAKELQKLLREGFVGKKLNGLFVDLEGYLESHHHSTDYIDLSCEGGGCNLIIGDELLVLGLHAEGQFNYCILPMSAVTLHSTKDFPPNDFTRIGNCFFDVNDHDITTKIAGQIIRSIEVKGTNMWCFSIKTFDEEKAEFAAKKNDLPAEIDIITDFFTLRLIGDDIEYYRLKIVEKN